MTARPRLLDLFCGAGGAAMTFPLDGFDVIHASPPCQLYTTCANRKRDGHPDLLGPVREFLKASGLPYVIENVANAPMPTSLLLCGATFGLPIVRHRRFEINPDPGLMMSTCPQRSFGRAVYHGPGFYAYGHQKWRKNWRLHVVPVVWPWMTAEESGEAVPPAYTEHVGRQLLDHLRERAT